MKKIWRILKGDGTKFENWLFAILLVLFCATTTDAADYAESKKVDGLADVGAAITKLTKVPVQDMGDTDKIGYAEIEEIVNKGLEAPGAIGGTTPAAGAFTTIIGTARISTTVTTEQMRLSYDATNYMTVTLADDGHTTIATVDPDGAEADINFTPDGNVGINTAAPGSTLDVTGTFAVSGNATLGGTMAVTGAHAAASYTADASANPQMVWKDSDCTDSDANVYYSINCTATGTGAEDCDNTLYQQVGGTPTEVFTADAQGASGTNSIINFPTAITGIANIVSIGNTEGVQDGGDDAALMTDSGESLTVDAYIGMTVYNVTDGSSCTITDNAGTTITCTLAGGTGDDWDDGDVWVVGPGPKQSGSAFFISESGTLMIMHPATVGYMALYFVSAAQIVEITPVPSSGMTINFSDDGVYTDPTAEDKVIGDGTIGDYIGIINESATEAHSLGVGGSWADGGAI